MSPSGHQMSALSAAAAAAAASSAPETGAGGSSGPETPVEDVLQGEAYIYKILVLLFQVSGSKVCQKVLCSSKWLSLLMAGVGYGGLGVQRRLLRLLRRLLMYCDPNTISAYVPSFFDARDEITFAEDPLDNATYAELMKTQSDDGEMDVDGSLHPDQSPSPSSPSPSFSRIITFFLVNAPHVVLFPLDALHNFLVQSTLMSIPSDISDVAEALRIPPLHSFWLGNVLDAAD